MKPVHTNPPDAPSLLDEAERAHARVEDPDTSHAAAAVQKRVERERVILGLFVLFGPMTDDELVGRSGDAHGPTVKTARSRLSKANTLIDTGERRKSDRGRDMIVWRLSDG